MFKRKEEEEERKNHKILGEMTLQMEGVKEKIGWECKKEQKQRSRTGEGERR